LFTIHFFPLFTEGIARFGMVKHIKIKHYLCVIGIESLGEVDRFFAVRELEAKWVGGRCEGNDWLKLSAVDGKVVRTEW